MSIDPAKPLPNAIGAERSVLSVCLQHPESIVSGRALGLCREAFSNAANGALWSFIVALKDDGAPIELVSVSQKMKDCGLLENIGGAAELSRIYTYQPIRSHFEHHVGLIREKWALRQIIASSTTAAEQAYDGGSADPVSRELQRGCEQARKALSGRGSSLAIPEAIGGWLDTFERALKGEEETRLPTGLPLLDGALGGGLGRGWVTVIGGPPKKGKTALALQIVANYMLAGMRCVIVSLEMSESEIIERMICRLSGTDMSKVTNPTLFPPSEDELASIAQAGSTLSKMSCHFTPPSIDAIDAIQDEVALLDAGEGVDVILVDYIQLVDGIRHRGDTRETEVASVSKGLKRMAKKHNAIVLGLSQLTGNGAEVRFRESGSILQDCHVALILNDDGMTIGAGRQIAASGKIPLTLNGKYQRFE